MRRTKIVATIGPASRDPETLLQMVNAGMDVARLNFSHGTVEEHTENARRVREAAGRGGRPVAILQDLPGPKLRIGRLSDGTVELKPGDCVTFTCGTDGGDGDERHMSINWGGLADAMVDGEVLYLADGSVRLRTVAVRSGDHEFDAEVEVGGAGSSRPGGNVAGGRGPLADGAVRLRTVAVRSGDHEFDAEVEVGGAVSSRQGVNVPGEVDRLPSVPVEDLEHLRNGERIGVDMVALSFVRRPEDVTQLREHTRLPLIAKIEKPQAVARAEEILRVADCVMVARGDLGIELPIEEVPIVQKKLLAMAGGLARPSITATQMLDSMVISSRPTRAEVADVANAILDGTDAVMLSQETAVGAHPVGAIAMMAAVAVETEKVAPYERWGMERVRRDSRDPAYTVAHSACVAARELELDALVIPTLSGRSARLVSAHRPNVPVYALSPGRETVRRCGLMWGVTAASMRRFEVTEDLIAEAARRVVELGWCKPGARVGITAGLPSGRPGTTSLFQVQTV